MLDQEMLDQWGWVCRGIVVIQLPIFHRPHVRSFALHVWNVFSIQALGQPSAPSNDDPRSPNFSISQQQLHSQQFGPTRTLTTLRWCAAIFELVQPLLNLCYTHRIISKHLLNITNCFALKITKVFTKFDAVPLLNKFIHTEKIGNPTNTLCNISLSDKQAAFDTLDEGDNIHTCAWTYPPSLCRAARRYRLYFAG